MVTQQFNRRAEVSVEHRLGGTDSFRGFRIAFDITHTETDDADLSRLSIYNLGPERINELRSNDLVRLSTGYAGLGVLPLHTSRLRRVRQVDESGVSDRVDLHVAETDLQSTIINTARRGAYPVQYAARDVFDVARIPVDIEELQAAVPLSQAVNNWSASGRAVDVLNDLLTPFGAKCKVVAGEGRFYRDGAPDPLNRVFEVSERTGMIGSPIEADDGVRVRVVLNNLMEPGIQVDLQARHTSGRFKVLKVVHRGDTWAGGDWHSELSCALR